jgi:hypothetical protein
MNTCRIAGLMMMWLFLSNGVRTAEAQFNGMGGFGPYGGYGYGAMGMGGFGMGGFASPYTYGYGYPGYGMGGFAPGFSNMVPPGYLGMYANNPGIYGLASPGMGSPTSGNPFLGYPGFGWWPLSARDLKVTMVPVNQSQRQLVSEMAGAQSGGVSSPSEVSATSPPVHTGAAIKLVCPKTTGRSLTYRLNGYTYTIHPGYSQDFSDDRVWTLEFHRGGDETDLLGYTLKPGKYNFSVGTDGWELRMVVSTMSTNLPPAPQPMPMDSTRKSSAASLSPTPQPPPSI